jgi:hypothetical protein
MDLPTIADVNEQRVAKFQQRSPKARRRPGEGIPASLVEEYNRQCTGC